MRPPIRAIRFLGWILPALVFALVACLHHTRIGRIQELSALSDWSVPRPEPSTNSKTGFKNDTRSTVWPNGDFALKRAIEQAQGENSPSLFSAGNVLRLFAQSDAEHAAMYLNSVSYLCIGLIAALFMAWRYGERATQLFCLIFFGAYPLVAAFVPGRIGLLELFSGLFGATEGQLDLLSWWQRDGLSSSLLATVLPTILLLPITWNVWRQRRARRPFCILVAITWLVVVLALWRTAFFALADIALAVIVGASGASGAKTPDSLSLSWYWLGAITLFPGFVLIVSSVGAQPAGIFSPTEWQALVMRDLAHTLAARDAHAVVLASPATSADLAYAGGLRTLANVNSPSAETVVRICESTTAEEAQKLVEAHAIRFLVFPNWDLFFRGAGSRPTTFIEQLHQFNLPPWLRPIPYLLPALPGQAEARVVIFEVVSEQDEPTALANLGFYFLETGSLNRAQALQPALDHFPSDLAAILAEVEIDHAQNLGPSAREKIASLIEAVRGGADQALPFDQRVRLALILARENSDNVARSIAVACAGSMDSPDALNLSPRDLLRFLALCHYYHIELTHGDVERFAWSILPPGSQEKIRID